MSDDTEKILPSLPDSRRFTGSVPLETDLPNLKSLGNGLTLISEQKVQLNHKLAERLLLMAEIKIGKESLERPLNDDRVKKLLIAMQDGSFFHEWVNLVTCVCKESIGGNPPGTEYRINGQHTCWARLHMPDDYKCPVKIQKYEAKSLNDLRLLYATMDGHYVRSKQSALYTLLVGVEDLGINRLMISLISAGFAIWKWESTSDRQRRGADIIASHIRTEYLNATKVVANYLAECGAREHKHVRRAPVIAAMYATFQTTVQKAHLFWDGVRDGIGMECKNDPRLKIRTFLLESSLGTTKVKTTKKTISQEQMYRGCINAWNAWREGRELSVIRSDSNSKRPRAK